MEQCVARTLRFWITSHILVAQCIVVVGRPMMSYDEYIYGQDISRETSRLTSRLARIADRRSVLPAAGLTIQESRLLAPPDDTHGNRLGRLKFLP